MSNDDDSGFDDFDDGDMSTPTTVDKGVKQLDLQIVRGEDFTLVVSLGGTDAFAIGETFVATISDTLSIDTISLSVVATPLTITITASAEQTASMRLGFGYHWRLKTGTPPSSWLAGAVEVVSP